VRLVYRTPEGEDEGSTRGRSSELPQPKEIKPASLRHRSSAFFFRQLPRHPRALALRGFLAERVQPGVLRRRPEICRAAKLSPNAKPRSLRGARLPRRSARRSNPPDHGRRRVQQHLADRREGDLRLYQQIRATSTRRKSPPAVYRRAILLIIEAGSTFGKGPRAGRRRRWKRPGRRSAEGEQQRRTRSWRGVSATPNRVPLLYQQSRCAGVQVGCSDQ